LPVFIKRQVLVNFPPRGMRALSGTVTSSRRTALSWHEPAADGDTVPSGVVVVDASCVEAVEVGGTPVGRDNPGLVGGRVEVTNAGGADVLVSSETLMQEPKLRLASRMRIQIFFIRADCTLKRQSRHPLNWTGFLTARRIMVWQRPGRSSQNFRRTSIPHRFE